MKHNSHHGHFEAPREKRRLTGKQKGIIGIVLALAVLAGVATGIYKTLVKPPEKPQPVQEETQDANTQPEPEVKKPTIKHVVTKVDEQTGEEVEEETELPASHQTGVYNILICGTDDDGYRTDTIIVAHLNETTHDVALMSVPRDTVVLNGSGGIMKINSVYAGGGADGMARLSKRLGAMLGFELDLIVVDRAHSGFNLRSDRADGGKVVRADELLRRALHDGLVEVLGVKPRAVYIKRILDRGIIDQVGILLFDTRADGIEAVMHLHRAGHDDIPRQVRIEGVWNAVDRDARVGPEVRHIDLCMHACVRSAATGDMHLVSHDHRRRLFQRLTDRDIIFLYLPAVIGGPEVAECQGNVSHSVLPCQKSFTAQTAAAQSRPQA